MFALTAPGKLHLRDLIVVVQGEPRSQLQFLRPGHHGGGWLGATVAHDFDGGGVDAQHHFDTLGIERQVTHAVF